MARGARSAPESRGQVENSRTKEVDMKTHQLMFFSLIGALVLWSGLGWAQQPQYGGTLRLALAGDMTFFNAHQGPAPGGHTYWVWNNIFNSLLTITPPPELEDRARAGQVVG